MVPCTRIKTCFVQLYIFKLIISYLFIDKESPALEPEPYLLLSCTYSLHQILSLLLKTSAGVPDLYFSTLHLMLRVLNIFLE